ncbi:MAG: hypothetical protein O3B24_08650 [Verrucomicrobia bacterium]|nr:hypothetical protein [Verrucomicrobiota bacterium]
MKLPPKQVPIENMEQAMARIAVLEQALDDAITLLVKRDNLLESYERKLRGIDKSRVNDLGEQD